MTETEVAAYRRRAKRNLELHQLVLKLRQLVALATRDSELAQKLNTAISRTTCAPGTGSACQRCQRWDVAAARAGYMSRRLGRLSLALRHAVHHYENRSSAK